jgi:hypothetical protein
MPSSASRSLDLDEADFSGGTDDARHAASGPLAGNAGDPINVIKLCLRTAPVSGTMPQDREAGDTQ